MANMVLCPLLLQATAADDDECHSYESENIVIRFRPTSTRMKTDFSVKVSKRADVAVVTSGSAKIGYCSTEELPQVITCKEVQRHVRACQGGVEATCAYA